MRRALRLRKTDKTRDQSRTSPPAASPRAAPSRLAARPEGYDAFVVAELTRALASAGEGRAVTLVFVARDGVRAQSFIDALAFAAPEIEALYLAVMGLPAL